VRRALKAWDVPGAAVGVVRGDRVVLARGYGVRDRKRGSPVGERTLFNIASCSKAFTATALGMLVDDGRLDWDAPVRRYIPSFGMHDRLASARVTVRDLLCHRTGVPAHDLVKQSAACSRPELVRRCRHLPPTADFRSRWQYNNIMYIAAGYVLERIAGQTWEQFTAERIFGPLGMTATRFVTDEVADDPQMAVGYDRRGGRLVPWLRIFRRRLGLAEAMGRPCGPNGSIVSNVVDMCRWLRCQLAGGRLGRRRIISEATLAEIHSPQVVVPDWRPAAGGLLDASYCLGWFCRPYRDHRWLFHGGGGRGFNSYTSLLPNERIGVVVLTNIASSPVRWIVTHEVLDRLLGLARVDWIARAKAEEKAAAPQPAVQRPAPTGRNRPLSAYAGDYVHPGYGPLAVSVDGERLVFAYNRFLLRFRRVGGDVFQMVRRIGDGGVPRTTATFHAALGGRIDAVGIPFVDTAPEIDIIFKRVAARRRRRR
jgi:CubicO group peptidase (beta-lactamase class C family)